jgi:hypothetical protein
MLPKVGDLLEYSNKSQNIIYKVISLPSFLNFYYVLEIIKIIKTNRMDLVGDLINFTYNNPFTTGWSLFCDIDTIQVCKKCKTQNEYARLNQVDGSYICRNKGKQC